MGSMDLRSFINKLEEKGELYRVNAQVDWKFELGAIISRVLKKKGPALLFENVKDYKTPVFSAGLLTPRRFAIALEMAEDIPESDMISQIKDRIKQPIKPILLDTGPCKENIMERDDVDLLKFPVPLWHELDGGRYIGCWHCVVTKDPDTDWQNVGMYRMMIHDSKTTGILISPFQHIGFIYAKYEAMNKPMPIAVSIGQDPVCPLVALVGFPAGLDEWTMAGALRNAPLELVKCETVDLHVPASAEIVLEGEVPPKERRREGPFGEHTGHYGGGVVERPFIKVKCVTHRNNPIYRGAFLQRPVDEGDQACEILNSAVALKTMEDFGVPGIKAINFPAEGDPAFLAIISLKKSYQGHSKDAARALMGSKMGTFLKHVIVVDDDINVFDLGQVIYAINIRFQPGRDLVVTRCETGSVLDPSVPFDWRGITDKMVIDATWPMTPDFPPRDEWLGRRHPPLAEPTEEIMKVVDKRWEEYGIKI